MVLPIQPLGPILAKYSTCADGGSNEENGGGQGTSIEDRGGWRRPGEVDRGQGRMEEARGSRERTGEDGGGQKTPRVVS